MKRKIPIVPLLVMAVLIALGIFVDRQRAAKQSLISGVFESQPTQMASRQSGRVSRILVKEGQFVKRGDLLIELEATPDQYQVNALQAKLAEAQARQQQTVKGPRAEEIARQEAVVRQLEAALARATNGPRPEEIEQAAERARQVDAKLAEARHGARPEEVAAAAATARQALAQYQAARRGDTNEERAQLQARFDSAKSQEEFAMREATRREKLAAEGAIAVREADSARSQATAAAAARKEAQEALLRAQRGTPEEELNAARQGYENAQARLDLLKAGTRREEIAAAAAVAAEAHSALNLLRAGTRREDILIARAELEQQRAQLDQLKNGSRPEEIAQAAATTRGARASVRSAEAKLKESRIIAAVDGVVDRVFVADGDLVNAGTMVVRVNNPADIWLRIYVPETILAKFKAGDPATLQIDGTEGITQAVVESIATEGEYTPANLQTPEERGKQVFAVRIRLKSGPTDANGPVIKAGMSATVKSLGTWQ